MSKFLSIVRDSLVEYKDLTDSEGWGCEVEEAINEIDSLGECAVRMLEIGIAQDRLAELGLSTQGVSRSLLFFDNPKPIKNGWMGGVEVYFNEEAALCVTNREIFEYSSPTWQDDLISRVKELIDE